MRGVDLYGWCPLHCRQEAVGSVALFAASPAARSARGTGPIRLQHPREGGSCATAAPGRCRAQLRLERAPRAGLAQRPEKAPLKNRVTVWN